MHSPCGSDTVTPYERRLHPVADGGVIVEGVPPAAAGTLLRAAREQLPPEAGQEDQDQDEDQDHQENDGRGVQIQGKAHGCSSGGSEGRRE